MESAPFARIQAVEEVRVIVIGELSENGNAASSFARQAEQPDTIVSVLSLGLYPLLRLKLVDNLRDSSASDSEKSRQIALSG
jgi:hypothetical protein